LQAGSFSENNREIRIDAGNLFTSRQDLESVVVAVDHGRLVYLRDVADQILDGPADPANYVLFGTTNASAAAQKNPHCILQSPSRWPNARARMPPTSPTRRSSGSMK
jgi:hypothetical protein